MNINDLTGSWYLGQRGHAHQPRKPTKMLVKCRTIKKFDCRYDDIKNDICTISIEHTDGQRFFLSFAHNAHMYDMI